MLLTKSKDNPDEIINDTSKRKQESGLKHLLDTYQVKLELFPE